MDALITIRHEDIDQNPRPGIEADQVNRGRKTENIDGNGRINDNSDKDARYRQHTADTDKRDSKTLEKNGILNAKTKRGR
jgi:hypothetical protein